MRNLMSYRELYVGIQHAHFQRLEYLLSVASEWRRARINSRVGRSVSEIQTHEDIRS
jgi:hypothetical protein